MNKKTRNLNSDQEEVARVLQLATYFQQSDLSHFEIKIAGLTVCFKREPSTRLPLEKDKSMERTQAAEIGTLVKAPLAGIYYESKLPGVKALVEVGDFVKKGEVIGIIEAMKLMNEIEAPCAGVVRKVMVTNGAIVGLEDPLMLIV